MLNNNDFSIHNKIIIDASTDLSVDTSTYNYSTKRFSNGLITHNDKIVIYNYFNNNIVVSPLLKYLQMDKDGSNKQLLTFNEINDIQSITYNSSNSKIMIFGQVNDAEYIYDNGTKLYIFDNTYNYVGYNWNIIGKRFDSNIVWQKEEIDPVGASSLSKYNNEYNNGRLIISEQKLKEIYLHKLNFHISDFIIDGEYLWLLSERTGDGKYKLMKVKPL